MYTLKEIQEALAKKEKAERKSIKSDSPYFPFWQMQIGQSVTIRLFPDADPEAVLPFREKRMVTLPFAGVTSYEDREDSERVTVEIPSLTMFDIKAKDPIVEATRDYWNKKSDDYNVDLARLYHYRRSFLWQGVVVGGDLTEEGRENDVRIFNFNKPLHEQLEAFMMDVELEYPFTDAKHGLDITISKGKNGDFASYSVKLARKERPLTEAEQEAFNNGRLKLEDFMPAKPEAETLKGLFESSIKSEAFDPEKFEGIYYRIAPNAKTAVEVM